MLKQASLFVDEPTISPNQIINVAQVTQLSPFRYPGGKTWLIPYIKTWLSNLKDKPEYFIEPFAGGGIVSLTVAYEGLADKVIMSEIDEDVAAVWHTIFAGDVEWLIERIINFKLTAENIQAVLLEPAKSNKEKAFQTILRNRISHGGILAPGAGIVKHGENGKGLASRWYPQTLKKRLHIISKLSKIITFVQGDGFDVCNQYIDNPHAVFFFDPPYTAGGKSAGRRLYTHSVIDHPKLFELASKIPGEFLMTYEISDEVRGLAKDHHFEFKPIPMQNRRNAVMKELLISRSLEWLVP